MGKRVPGVKVSNVIPSYFCFSEGMSIVRVRDNLLQNTVERKEGREGKKEKEEVAEERLSLYSLNTLSNTPNTKQMHLDDF